MTSDSVDTFKACRTCGTFYLSNSEYLRSIFCAGLDPPEMELIRNEIKCWKIGILENDGYPQNICTICIEEFAKIFAFRTSCIATQQQLRRIYRRDVKDVKPLLSTTDTDTKLPDIFESSQQSNEYMSNMKTLMNIKTEKKSPLDLGFIVLDALSESDGEGYNAENTYKYISVKKEKKEASFGDIESSVCSVPSKYIENANDQETTSSKDQETMASENSTENKVSIENTSHPHLTNDVTSNFESNSCADNKNVEAFPSADESTSLSCSFCVYYDGHDAEKVLFRSNDLKEHIDEKHKSEKPYSCAYCSETFVSVHNCKIHVKYQHCDLFVKCDICDHMSATKLLNRQHKRKIHNISDYKCAICQKKFKNISSKRFYRHIQCHEQNDYFKCTQCDYICNSRTKLINHTNAAHEKKRNTCRVCRFCNKTCVSGYSLKMHLKQHIAAEKCPYCSKEFKNNADKEKHIWFEHAEIAKEELKRLYANQKTGCNENLENDVNTPECFQKAASSSCSDHDLKTTHEARILYSCAVCPATFLTQKSLLCHHQSKHRLNTKSSSNCKLCGKSFELKFSLNQHIKRFHSNGSVKLSP